MTNIWQEWTSRISDGTDTLILDQDVSGNLELSRTSKRFLESEESVTIPKEFIPHLIEVLQEHLEDNKR